MFYYLYKITNKVNGKIYVGVHKTNNMDDGYMGSGKVITSAIEKYGLDNFSKDILETFENSKDMYAREREVVTEDFLERNDVYNLRRGGFGGFEYINKNPEKFLTEKRLNSLMDNEERLRRWKEKFENDKDFYDNVIGHMKVITEICKKKYPNGTFFNKKHTEKTKTVISEKAKNRLKDPSKNSQFGTMWITNGYKNKKIKTTDQIPENWRKGRICK